MVCGTYLLIAQRKEFVYGAIVKSHVPCIHGLHCVSTSSYEICGMGTLYDCDGRSYNIINSFSFPSIIWSLLVYDISKEP